MPFSRLTFLLIYMMHTLAAINVPSTLQKCCKPNEALNISPMFCTAAPNLKDTSFFFDAATRFGKPNCKSGTVIVGYYSTTTPLILKDDFLIIPEHNNSAASIRIPADSFCLDNVFDGVNSSHVWATWVCQPDSVCDHIPCVRKCCGPSQHLLQVDGITHCVTHENKSPFVPEFHNVEDNSTYNTGVDKYVEVFGVKYHEKCLTYLEHNTVGDQYLLDSKTGHIFSNYSWTTYNHSNYCVDHTDDGTMVLHFCHDPSETWWIVLILWTSMVLVIITLIVHFIVTTTSTLLDRAQFRFLLCLVLSYAFVATAALLTQTYWWICWILSYVVFCISLCYYTWLSVVIFEIYRFSRQNFSGSTMTNRFRYYSIYAWGTALAVTIISRLLQSDVAFFYVTNPSTTSCLYHIMNYEIYFLVVALILIYALLMCGLIKWNIRKRTREANAQYSESVYRAVSMKHVTLVVVTVIAIIVIVASEFFVGNLYFLFKIIETGPGIFVFIIFVLNRDTVTTIKRKWNQEIYEPESVSDSDAGITMTVKQNSLERTNVLDITS